VVNSSASASPSLRTDKWGRPIPQLTAQQIATTKQVLNQMQASALMPHQKFLQLNLSDPVHKQFFDDRFGHLTGSSAVLFFPSHTQLVEHMVKAAPVQMAAPSPMLNGATAATHSLTPPPVSVIITPPYDPTPWTPPPVPVPVYQPVAIITLFDYATADSNKVIAAGLVSLPNALVTICTMQIFQNDDLIAQGSGSSYGNSTTAANATGTQSSPGAPLRAVFSGYYAVEQGAEAVPFTVSQDLFSPVPKLSLNVTNPVHTVTTAPNPITVALGRGPNGGQDMTDYYYSSDVKPYAELELAVSGTATPNSPSDVFNTQDAVTGSLILIRQNGAIPGGGSAIFPGNINQYCTVKPDQLSWNFSPADFHENPPPWTSGDTILFTLNLTVMMNGSTPVVVTVTSDQSGTIVGDQPQNTSIIDSLIFYWGCLAGETLIEMADGSRKAIREIAVGERVRSQNGAWLEVHGAKLGREAKPMIQITWGSDAKVLMTDGHPVLTEKGLTAARDLAVGDIIRVADGYSTIHAIDAIFYDGLVHNLTLIDESGDFPDQAAFLAGGLWVGDDRMQTKVEEDSLNAVIRATDLRLDESLKGWELDIENHRRLEAGEALLSLLPQKQGSGAPMSSSTLVG